MDISTTTAKIKKLLLRIVVNIIIDMYITLDDEMWSHHVSADIYC